MTDLDFQQQANALASRTTPDPYVDSLSQAKAAAARAERDLQAFVQAQCPEGVSFRGIQRAAGRYVYAFNDDTEGGTSFSIRPEHLTITRIAAELHAARVRVGIAADGFAPPSPCA